MNLKRLFYPHGKKSWVFIHKTNHIFKTALAVAISWDIVSLTGMKHSFFAPIAAIICLQITVEDSILKGYSRVLAIIIGVMLADVFVKLVGVHDWSIALLVTVCLALAMLFKFKQDAAAQVGISALLVITAGGGNFYYGLDRIIETIIGAFSAIMINMFIFPPDFTETASLAVAKTMKDMSHHLIKLSNRLKEGATTDVANELLETSEKLNSDVQEAQNDVAHALYSSKFSPLARHRRTKMLHIQQKLESLEKVYKIMIEMQNILLGCGENDHLAWSERIRNLAEIVDKWEENDVNLENKAAEILNLSELAR